MNFFRDFAYFSKGERNGFIVLMTIILLLTFYVFFSKQFVPKPEHQPEVYQNLKSQFEKNYDPSIVENAAYDKDNYKKSSGYAPSYSKSENHKKRKKKTFVPFEFDPNTIDLAGLQKLGFSEKQAQSILNYRNKGGQFRKAEDFKKMYVVSDQHFRTLKSYIVFPKKTEFNDYQNTLSVDSLDVSEPKFHKKNTLVDISMASEEELKTVHGIGDKLSARIIKYRNMLGGFYSIEQLKEVYGIDEDNYEAIATQIKSSAEIWEFVDVNKAYASQLKKHPYIKTWDFANKIVYHKRKHPFKDWEDFQNKLQLDEETAVKLKPYLIFK